MKLGFARVSLFHQLSRQKEWLVLLDSPFSYRCNRLIVGTGNLSSAFVSAAVTLLLGILSFSVFQKTA